MIIKFRVYHKKTKQYLKRKNNRFFLESFIYSFSFILNNPEKFVVEQYTGLNDENNVPIYVGDIIEYSYKLDEHGDLIFGKGIVDFANGAFGIKNDDWFCNYPPSFKAKVIGNTLLEEEVLN